MKGAARNLAESFVFPSSHLLVALKIKAAKFALGWLFPRLSLFFLPLFFFLRVADGRQHCLVNVRVERARRCIMDVRGDSGGDEERS